MKAKNYILTCITVFVIYLFHIPVAGQELPGIPDSLYSNVLGEERAIQIVFPENYEPGSAETYDAIYLLDGEWNTGHFKNIREFLRQEGFIPDFIIVGLPNTYIENINQRNRDFLAVTSAPGSQSGEAEKFIQFLENELKPYIEGKYPVNDESILYGHSYGGLFAVYVYLMHPEIFDGYFATDPSLWWGNRELVDYASEKMNSASSEYEDKSLWIAGITNTADGMGITAIDSVFNTLDPEDVYWKIATYPNETHNSVRFKGIYDGLKFMYSGYNSRFTFHPMNGILLEEFTTPLFLQSDLEEIRFTTDGSDPDTSSPVLTQGTEIFAPATVVAASITGRKKYARKVTGIFEVGDVLPTCEKPLNSTPGGLNYRVYEGKWESLPDFNKLTAVTTGRLNKDFNFNNFPLENFGLVFEGFLEITEPGHYIFALDSDDGSKLTLGDKVLIDYDGLHGTGRMQSYVIPLSKGFYPIRLEYFQAGQGRSLDLVYVTPGSMDAIDIPLELQYSKE